MILYDMKDDGEDGTYDMKETEAPLDHRFDPHGSHPGGGRIFACRRERKIGGSFWSPAGDGWQKNRDPGLAIAKIQGEFSRVSAKNF